MAGMIKGGDHGAGAAPVPPRRRRGGDRTAGLVECDAAEDPRVVARPVTVVFQEVNEFGGQTTRTTKKERDGDVYRVISIQEIKYNNKGIVKARTHLPVE